MKVLLALCAVISAAVAQQEHVILDCFGYYVDGYIYLKTNDFTGAPFPDLPPSRSFSLALYSQGWSSGERVYDTQRLTRYNGDQHWDVFPDVLYLDTSPGAYAPVGFKSRDELEGGQVDKYWGLSYGALWFADKPVVGNWIDTFNRFSNGGGFTHQPVEGRDDVVQLYWNQTQFEEFQAGRTPTDVAPWFPLCFDGWIATVAFKGHP